MNKHHIVVIVVVALLLAAFTGARVTAQEAASAGPPAHPPRVLIATETSTFKDRLVAALRARLQQRKVEVTVIDVTGLADVDAGAWRAIVIIHTWEFGMPPPAVGEFVARISDPGPIIDVTTSSSGAEKLPGVDVVSSASTVDEVPDLVAEIESRIDARLTRP